MSDDIRIWFRQQPFTTKWLTLLSFIIPLLIKFRLVNPGWFVFDLFQIRRLQLWRLLSPFFLAQVNFNFIISLYFRAQYSFFLETTLFASRAADYLCFILFSTLTICLSNTVWPQQPLLWESITMAIIYVWSRHNQQTIVNFMFGFKFPAIYLPLVLALFDVILAGDIAGPVHGIIAGHLYYFLTTIYAEQSPRWRTRLNAPSWLKSLIPEYQSASGASFSGFTVRTPAESFGGRSNAASAKQKADPSFSPFVGKPQKLGK